MAFSVVETKVANPAEIISLVMGNPAGRKKRKTNMAKRHLSAKQIKFFGTKAQKAALKRKRKSSAKKSFHRKRTTAAKPRKRFRSNPARPVSFVLGSGKRSSKKVAKSKKKSFKKAASHSHRSNAGRRKSFSRGRRRNPAIGRPMDWVKGGAGVLVGVVVTRGLPQMVFSASNTGVTGYAMNAGTAILAAWGTHVVTKDPVLTASVAAGGFAALIARIISDYTSFGQYLSLSGVGDYQFSNIVGTVPQRINPGGWQQANMQVGWGAPAGIASGSPVAAMDSGRYSSNV